MVLKVCLVSLSIQERARILKAILTRGRLIKLTEEMASTLKTAVAALLQKQVSQKKCHETAINI